MSIIDPIARRAVKHFPCRPLTGKGKIFLLRVLGVSAVNYVLDFKLTIKKALLISKQGLF
jgi:hypothetical protein